MAAPGPSAPANPTSGVGMQRSTNITEKKVNVGLLRRGWSNKIHHQSLQVDPLMNIPTLTGVIDPGKSKNVKPGKVFQDVTPKGDEKFARSITLQYTKALQSEGKYGYEVDTVQGNEESVRLMYFQVFANDWGHAVTGQTFGVDFRELKLTQIFEITKELLSQWYGELDGYFARHGLIQSVSPNLEYNPIALTSALNANCYVVGADASSGTLYQQGTQTDAAHEAAVVAALDAVAAQNSFTVSKLLKLCDVASDSYIKPIMWEGYELYMLYVASEEFTKMLDPEYAGSFSQYWLDAAALGSGQLKSVIPGAEFVIGDSIVVCRDRRTAQAQVPTGGTGWSINYLLPGRNDQRVATSADKLFNCNLLLGEVALVKFNPEAPHFKERRDMYEKYKNVGYFGACGYMTPKWQDNPSDATPAGDQPIIQEGSMLVLTGSEKSTAW